MTKTYTTQAIAEALEGQLIGNGNIQIDRVAHPADSISDRDLVLAVDPKLIPLLGDRKPRAIVVNKDTENPSHLAEACIVVSRPRLAMAKLTNLFAETVHVTLGIHPSAVIHETAKIGTNVSIGPGVYVGANAVVGYNSVLHPQSYVGPHAVIGANALIHAGVKIAHRVVIGMRCIIHFNAVIGADGFSFVTPQLGSVESVRESGSVGATNNELVRIASLGNVIIGDDVEIGANTSIDRGTIAATRIGNGTKIDNQVQIGHNVVIGDNCLICGRTGIAGSATIGNRVVLGGGTGVADHAKIGDDVVAMALSGISGNVASRIVVGGMPALPRERAMEIHMNIGRLGQYMKKVDALTEKLKALEEKEKKG